MKKKNKTTNIALTFEHLPKCNLANWLKILKYKIHMSDIGKCRFVN